MSVFSDIIGAGLGLNRQLAGELITYRRGSDEIDELKAKPRGGERLVERSGSAVLLTDEMEWLIKADELLLDETAIQPMKGDEIDWTIGGETLTFKLLQPAGMEQCWKWADRGHTHYHVFCKLTGKA